MDKLGESLIKARAEATDKRHRARKFQEAAHQLLYEADEIERVAELSRLPGGQRAHT